MRGAVTAADEQSHKAAADRPARRALADTVPIVAGYLPFGFVLGATVAASDVPDVVGWAASPIVFAGAAQLAIIELLDAGAGIAVVVATAWVINLRHVMYSGAIAPYFLGTPLWWRLLAPHVMVDPVYSLAAVRFREYRDSRSQRVYWAVSGGFLLLCWSAMTGAGVLLGARLPDWSALELAVPLVFVALLIPSISDRPTLAAAVVGGVVTVAARGLPLHLGLVVGALSGIVAGVLLDGWAGDGEDAPGPHPVPGGIHEEGRP